MGNGMSTGGPDPGVGIAAGTQLSTPLGAIAIEDLRVGDAVVAGSGENTSHPRHPPPNRRMLARDRCALRLARADRPACLRAGHPGARFARGAWAACLCRLRRASPRPCLPARERFDGGLCRSRHGNVLDGRTGPPTIRSFAENLPLGTGEPVDAPPSAADPSDDLARPDLHDCGVVVDAVREQVKRRAEKLGWTPCLEVTISCLADGRRLDPVLADNHAFFTFYDGGAHLKIQTGMIVPSLLGGSGHPAARHRRLRPLDRRRRWRNPDPLARRSDGAGVLSTTAIPVRDTAGPRTTCWCHPISMPDCAAR